ncbi:MAG: glutaminase A [Firmicutes bacterium]|nr:glutaminase A [Bacillota bacterium]
MEQVFREGYENGLDILERGEGKVADYIPALAKADPKDFAICGMLINGDIIAQGDIDRRFSIQSISKVINLAVALRTYGVDEVFRHVMMEPSGDEFNSIIKLDTKNSLPFNPLINAGAIEVASMLVEKYTFEEMLQFARELCMDPSIELDEEVYRSEFETGNRNRAIAYLLQSKGVLLADPQKTVDLYFKMCSLSVSAKSLAGLGLVLACDGMNPFSRESLIRPGYVRCIKSIMFTCGLYDYSGEFGVDVGIPAKSGVGGGIMCAARVPMGIGLWGPALDEHGNSIASVRALEHISHRLHLHVFDYR